MSLQSFLPLSESAFYILLSFSTGPKHGYAVMKEVKNLSQERLNLSTGTLFGALKRFLEHGWIEKCPAPANQPNGRERKTYQLTDLGRKILDAELHRLRRLVTAAQVLAHPTER
jgi:DNA-binding PadR family transcriptional regulator